MGVFVVGFVVVVVVVVWGVSGVFLCFSSLLFFIFFCVCMCARLLAFCLFVVV